MKVIWTAGARADLYRIQTFLRQHSPKGAKRVGVRITSRVAKQAKTPYAAPLERSGPARCLVVTRTPYVVIYMVLEDELRVLAVFHTSQSR